MGTGINQDPDTDDPITDNPVTEVISSAEDSSLSAALREAYWEDAARLVMRKIKETGGSLSTEVEIPADTIQTFYDSIIRIYNAKALAARDTVVQMYQIHTYPYPTLHSLGVKVDTTYAWVSAWRSGHRLTGNPEIDTLMVRYQLKLVSCDQYFSQTLAFLNSENPLNIDALVDRFKGIDGVINASNNNPGGDGNDITVTDITDQFIQLDYSIGWTFQIGEGAPWGCLYHRWWQFRAFRDNRVQFVKSWGTPLPKP